MATLVVGDTAYVAHVGDSRAYLVNESGIQSITTDHSLVERYIAAGQLTPEEARHHPQANIVYRTIGEKAVAFGSNEELLKELVHNQQSGDVIVFMSPGSFSGIQHRIIRELTEARG